MSENGAAASGTATHADHHGHQQSLLKLAIGAVGVVFGDIGTSPLYAFKETFAGHHPLGLSTVSIYGVISLIFWTMMLVVTLKYVSVIMRADNRGEGGSLALIALISRLSPGDTRSTQLVLLGVMAVALKACCPFCILSAVLSLSLFVFSLLLGELEDPAQTIFMGVITAMLVAVLGLGWAASTGQAPAASATGKSAPLVISESSAAKVALAEHLTARGAVIYTAWWCPHCHEQQELFGRQAAAKLKVVECATDGRNSQTALCEQKKIQGFPTWEINGKLDSGVKPLKELADLSGYTGNRQF